MGALRRFLAAVRRRAKAEVDRGNQGIKRSTAVDGRGIPLASAADGANRNDSPLLIPTLDHASGSVGGLPEQASVHLDRGYDSKITRERLEDRGLYPEICQKGKPAAPLAATRRWVVERTNSWHNAHKKLWCGVPRGEGGSHRLLGSLL
jgi:hypothetical protein